MPVFRDPDKLAAHLKKALDQLQAETLITTQAELGSKKVSPVDTGRLRSSWFAAEGTASADSADVGTNSPNTDATSLKVDASKTYYLTNNLPYAQRVALEGHVVAKDANWFRDFVDGRVPKIQAAAAKVVKQQYEL